MLPNATRPVITSLLAELAMAKFERFPDQWPNPSHPDGELKFPEKDRSRLSHVPDRRRADVPPSTASPVVDA